MGCVRSGEEGEMSGPGPLAPGVPACTPLSVAFVATCPPRQCGIATFTSDLVQAVQAADAKAQISWAAIDQPEAEHCYGPVVRWRIRQGQPESYRQAAEQINASDVQVVNLQHEFGLYGVWGEPFEDHLAPFLETLRKPLVTTLHTVLPGPSASVREAVQRIGRHSCLVVAMADLACQLLVREYGVEPSKVLMVPHGVPVVPPRGRRRALARLGLRGRTVLSTFGLVGPRKGLEYMVRAMPALIACYPEALYLIVGRTHPELARQQGEAYREGLWGLVQELGLGEHVAFVDRYLTQQEIVEYLLATDVYVTPYLDPNQITSGTLAYALAAGKAVVSTPYLHATEALAQGRGLLVGFRSEEQLAEAVLRMLGDRPFRRALERSAYAYGHRMAWPNIGRCMLRLFRRIIAGRPATSGWTGPSGFEELLGSEDIYPGSGWSPGLPVAPGPPWPSSAGAALAVAVPPKGSSGGW